jgi:hypothetical protein
VRDSCGSSEHPGAEINLSSLFVNRTTTLIDEKKEKKQLLFLFFTLYCNVGLFSAACFDIILYCELIVNK